MNCPVNKTNKTNKTSRAKPFGIASLSGAAAVALLSVSFVQPAAAQGNNDSLDALLKSVQSTAERRSAESQQRLRAFEQQRDQQQRLLNEAKTALAAAEQRSEELKESFDANEEALTELQNTLDVRTGNFGEMFGVVRQAAGDAAGIVDSSLVTAQFKDRGEFLSQMSDSKKLPSIKELNSLRALLFEEMVESGKVVRFPANIVRADGEGENTEVVRVGVFNAIAGDRFLSYEPATHSLKALPRQPKDRYRSLAAGLFNGQPGEIEAMAVDPSRGSLLSLLIQAPGFKERIDQGGLVGYVIIGMGIIGLLIALERLFYLFTIGSKINSQRKSDKPNNNNALGRILNIYHENKNVDTETLELKLDEAILRETPALEKRQGIIKVFAAVAPLLGLLGTVVGMIATFQAITLFGTGDPKLMAGGISQALMTTVLGLVVAIPLVMLHSVVAGRSRRLTEVLEEQSAGIIARHSEKDVHHA